MAGADMAGADMAGADMAGVDVAGADVAGADVAGVEIDAGEERTFAGDSNAFAGEVVDDLDQEMGKNSSGGCQQRTHPLGPLWMIFLVMIFISSLKATPSEMSNE